MNVEVIYAVMNTFSTAASVHIYDFHIFTVSSSKSYFLHHENDNRKGKYLLADQRIEYLFDWVSVTGRHESYVFKSKYSIT